MQNQRKRMPFRAMASFTMCCARCSLVYVLICWMMLWMSPPQSVAQTQTDRAAAQQTPPLNPALEASQWPAFWIASATSPGTTQGVFVFRREIDLASVPGHFMVHVSADNRYLLHVNGQYAAEGPARGDLFHWRFETVDLAPFLHPGKNVIAAVVWNFAELSPVAQMSNRTGFLLQGDGPAESILNTGAAWRVRREPGRAALGSTGAHGYYAAGPAEKIDGRIFDASWDQEHTHATDWESPQLLGHAASREARDASNRWEMVADLLPPMEHRLTNVGRVVRVSGIADASAFPTGAVRIPPHTHVTILLDHRTLETAYPELTVSAGRNAEIRITYAEALYDASGRKGNRNDISGRHIEGITDEIVAGGNALEQMTPLWWRTWRYAQLDITTQDEPLTLDSMRAWFTAYPFQARASIAGDIPRLQDIWDTGWRTARLDAHETYMDAPYWEQLQYVGDTRIQALLSYVVAADARLARQAITNIDDSRVPEGITQSRYPSSLPQFIPPFSLYWVNMLHDYWMYVDDPALVRATLPHTRTVLDWFADRLRPDGLLGRLGWWEFADWTANYPNGEPPQDADGGSTLLTLQFVAALRDAAEMEHAYGSTERATTYRDILSKATEALNRENWDTTHGLYADTPAKTSWSAEANVLAVMLGVAPKEQRAPILRRILASRPDAPTTVNGVSVPALSTMSYYFRFYLSRAMEEAGLGDLYLSQLAPWYGMLDLGLSTWAETPEPTRSDCHAWSASPNYDLLTVVAGIHPSAPGFATVSIQPHLKGLHNLDASMPHPKGMIRGRYRSIGTGWTAAVTLPEGVTGTLLWGDRSLPLHAGSQTLDLPAQ